MTDANNQTKIKLTFLLAIIIVLGMSLIYFKFVFKKPVDLIQGLNVSTINLKAEQKKADEAIMEKTAALVSAKDPAQCYLVDRTVDGVNYKTVCLNNIYLKLAEEKLDYSACEKLVDTSADVCQRRVMQLIIAKEKNISACESSPEKFKSSCSNAFWNFSAVDQKKPALCVKTSSPETAISCQNNVLISLVNKKITFDCASFPDKQVKSDCENFLKGKDGCISIRNSMIRTVCARGL